MKIILTGSLGNISRPLAINLISQGHQVTVISSNNEKSTEITNLGAIPAIGSVSDEDFLTSIFKGSDLIYLMVPNDLAASDLRAHIRKTGEHYVNAIQKANIKKVVLLSSIGAHLDAGTGPIAGLAAVEKLFRKLTDVDILFLRPAYFYNNLYANIDMVKHMGIIGGNYGATQQIVLVDPQDIATIAAEKINADFNGHQTFYIASDRRSLKEVAEQLGQAIGKPELSWIEFDDTQSFDGMLQAGLPEDMAKNYVEMGTAIRSAILWEDFDLNKVVPEGKTKLEDFAVKFAAAYKA